MKCPNCAFEVQPGVEQCPFCSFVIPRAAPTADDVVPVDESGAPLDPPAPVFEEAPPSQPIPDPEAMVIQGTAPEPVPTTSSPPSEVSPPPAAKKPPPEALKYILIAGGGFLAFKLGLLDNLLLLTGLKSPPPPPPAPVAAVKREPPPAEAPAPSEPAASPQPAAPPEPAPGGPAPAPVPAAPKVTEWALEGKVYDMLTLKPVKGAVLLFMTPAEDETFETKTDAKGRWSLALPARKDGYKLVVDHSEYIADYFDETVPSYRGWTLAKRRQLRAAKPEHKPWQADAAGALRRDIVLFPDITDR